MHRLKDVIENFSIQGVQSLFRRNLNKFRADEINYDFLFEDKEIIISRFCKIQKIAEAELDNSGDMVFLTAQSIKELTSKSGKKIQYEIAKHILIEERKDAAIFIFYDEDGNFRFSFIRANYWGSKKDFTSFKRYTYYINNEQTNKTFASQMKKADFNNLDSIQDAFSVEPLTKEFYEKLQHWYFWAIHHVKFPSEPTQQDVYKSTKQTRASGENKLNELVHEHRAQNVIRLLTRILFVWFIKQKKLVPDELFDLDELQKSILNDISPYNEEGSLFAQSNKESIYYKAILQNLFFATLNCPAESSPVDKRSRGFRKKNYYGQDRDVPYLMKYENYFQNPDAFLELVNSVVPFLNGGLFECLDFRGEDEKKEDRRYIDGFSDNLPKEHDLIVPDYLFFGIEEKTDLSLDLGIKSKKAKEASVKGLINIFREYNFTIDENEPDDIEVALDPELLGKVFENLLASYNPETKTTARKQTGSFYTPREIVNYMVDESLIAYLKNNVDFDCDEKEQDEKLHTLFSYSTENPFENDAELTNKLLIAIDKCKILDPACGSGAFPMGILQKIVHILRKLDPGNVLWQEIQLDKAIKETSKAFKIMDKNERAQLLLDINEAFDETINSPDYSRKIFIIENCIYGVDIQPIAAQISKLRFFISLVVEQNVNDKKENNFGIRPLPNLETKFVTANTLIGIERPGDSLRMFDSPKVLELEQELKSVRHKLFSARTKDTKLKYRLRDKELRKLIADELINSGWHSDTAGKLSNWDPYDQNAVSPFFDPEWMFDISDGFDIVIGNPPYLRIQGIYKSDYDFIEYSKSNYASATGRFDLYCLFTEKGYELLNEEGTLNYIMPYKWLNAGFGKGLRSYLSHRKCLNRLISFSDKQIFTASTYTSLIWLSEVSSTSFAFAEVNENVTDEVSLYSWLRNLKYDSYSQIDNQQGSACWKLIKNRHKKIFSMLESHGNTLKSMCEGIYQGIVTGDNDVFILERLKLTQNTSICYSESLKKYVEIENSLLKEVLSGKSIKMYSRDNSASVILYPYFLSDNKTKLITEKELKVSYPLSFSYLSANFERLSTRGSENMKYTSWYSLWNARSIERFARQNKILTPDVCYKPKMWLDREGRFFNMDTSYAIILKQGYSSLIDIIYLVLNSSVTWFFLKVTGAVLRGGYFRFKTRYLQDLVLPKLSRIDVFRNIGSSIVKLIDVHDIDSNYFSRLYTLIDALVFELYFEDHMKERNIDVMQFVEKDIEDVFKGREFEQLNEEEKDGVVKELASRWSNPENEIVKRISSFKEKSPDILKVILES